MPPIPNSKGDLIRVLFVCSGNICRSPTGQGILESHVTKLGLAERFYIDSAGTSYGASSGRPPDKRSIRTSLLHGVDISGQRSRTVSAHDFSEFDYILAMTKEQVAFLYSLSPKGKESSIFLITTFLSSAQAEEIPDPYMNEDGFEEVFSLLELATKGFLSFLVQKGDIPPPI